MNYKDSEYFEFKGLRDYAFNFYYAVIMYGFGDIYARNPIENIAFSFCLIGSLMVSNFFVSDIAGLVGVMNAKSYVFQEKLD